MTTDKHIRHGLMILLKTTVALSFLASLGCAGQSTQTGATTETLVIFRHGEKPTGGLGQLSCRGLNRALALPDVLAAKFGKPDYIFAPDPAQKVDDYTLGGFSYVRPLVTIEPTAIRLGMSVNAQIGYKQIDKLQRELLESKYSSSTVFIAWEHYYEERFAKELVKKFGGDSNQIPEWTNSEYDMIYVIRLTRAGGKTAVSFSVDHEGLNTKLSDECPK
jgi:hypothetical protein